MVHLAYIMYVPGLRVQRAATAKATVRSLVQPFSEPPCRWSVRSPETHTRDTSRTYLSHV